jgi:hypothetical protein
MEDDPWGSTPADPWTKPSDEQNADIIPDPLNVPKEFTLDRRPSTTADHWGALSQDEFSSEPLETSYKRDERIELPQPVPPMVWATEPDDDGWGPVRVDALERGVESTKKVEEQVTEDSEVASPQSGVTVNDNEADDTVQDRIELSSSILRPSSMAGLSETLPAFSGAPVTPLGEESRSSMPDPADEAGFGGDPFPVMTALPTFQTSLPESPSFGNDGFGGFSSGFDDHAPLPEWGPTHKVDDDGWGSPTFDSPLPQTQDHVAADSWGESDVIPEEGSENAHSQERQEDEWERARKAIQRREAVAVSRVSLV